MCSVAARTARCLQIAFQCQGVVYIHVAIDVASLVSPLYIFEMLFLVDCRLSTSLFFFFVLVVKPVHMYIILLSISNTGHRPA
eukprot:m.149953 g.149953  ORF g.149953 m.149953 type:complete len:83 (+) comp16166_c6_seq2:2639-2887(+)